MTQKSSTAEIQADVVLDTFGLLCPIPIIQTAERVKSLPPGATLEVISTDSGLDADLANWCKSQKHEYLGCWQEGRIFRAFLKVSKTNKIK